MLDSNLYNRLKTVFDGVFFFPDDDPKNATPCRIRVHLPSQLLNPPANLDPEGLDLPLIEITRLHTNSRMSIFTHMEALRRAGNDNPDSPGRSVLRDSRSDNVSSFFTAVKASVAHLIGHAPEARQPVDTARAGVGINKDWEQAIESQAGGIVDRRVLSVVDLQITPGAAKKGAELTVDFVRQYERLRNEPATTRALKAALNTVGETIIQPAVNQLSDASAFGDQGYKHWRSQKVQQAYLDTAFSTPDILLKEYSGNDSEYRHRYKSRVLQDLDPLKHGMTIAYLPGGEFNGNTMLYSQGSLQGTGFAPTRHDLEESQSVAWDTLYGNSGQTPQWNQQNRFIRQTLDLDVVTDEHGDLIPAYRIDGEAAPLFMMRPDRGGANDLPPAEGQVTRPDDPVWLICSPHPEHDDLIGMTVDTAIDGGERLKDPAARNVLLYEAVRLLEQVKDSDSQAVRDMRGFMPADWSDGAFISLDAMEKHIGVGDDNKSQFFQSYLRISSDDIVITGEWADIFNASQSPEPDELSLS